MTEALREMLEQVEQLDPSLQETIIKRFQEVLAEELAEREWDALLTSPESQTFLKRLRREALEDIDAGELEEEGFAL